MPTDDWREEGVLSVVRFTNGVRPVDVEGEWWNGVVGVAGEENRTRLLLRFGVAGGVCIPCWRIDPLFWEWVGRADAVVLYRRVRRTARGRSSARMLLRRVCSAIAADLLCKEVNKGM